MMSARSGYYIEVTTWMADCCYACKESLCIYECFPAVSFQRSALAQQSTVDCSFRTAAAFAEEMTNCLKLGLCFHVWVHLATPLSLIFCP